VIVADARWADWIAVGETQLFLALNMRGARASGTRSSIASVPLSGGAPAELPGTETFGVEISGIAASNNVVYFSRVGGPALRDSGVFGYSGGPVVAVTAASLSSPAGLAFNTVGDLFIADTTGGRVLLLSSGTMTTYAGRAGCGDRTPPAPGPATEAARCGPELLALSSTGDLYVAGRGPSWIARVDTAIGGALLAATGSRLVRFDATGAPTTIVDDLGIVWSIAIGRDDSIYVLHSNGSGSATRVTRLRRV
jgi:hypothetical protein